MELDCDREKISEFVTIAPALRFSRTTSQARFTVLHESNRSEGREKPQAVSVLCSPLPT
jgi:hypothetical protein